ncbi:MAG: NUDIX domain-containing protein [Candidatus Peribacteria bacterium]|jgi:8-oxo-dGTP pyrophosphatase MutT (NUDIX family)|nr:NUDIX domain-containing protein [Candidatus Peribacteria bacterium]
MLITTLVFLFNAQGEMLLGMKKRGFGVGKWSGPGGKVHAGETIEQGALRELEEEVGVTLDAEALKYRGLLHFRFLDTGEAIDCSVFIANYDGEVKESEELQPQRFSPTALPFHQMWADGSIWYPELSTGGEDFVYEFNFANMDDKAPQRRKIK